MKKVSRTAILLFSGYCADRLLKGKGEHFEGTSHSSLSAAISSSIQDALYHDVFDFGKVEIINDYKGKKNEL